MAPQRNMGWRKPVPTFAPEASSTSSRASRTIKRLSLTIINKEVPPIPTEWRDTMEHTLTSERRYAVYLSTPPSPPPKDGGSFVGSRRESLAITLVEGQEDATPIVVVPPHDECRPIECVERTRPTPAITRRASQKSLPKIYRPPTPPLPAQHPKLRSGGHSRASLQSQEFNQRYQGQFPAEQSEPTPCAPTLMFTGWPSGLVPDVSVTAHSLESRSNILSLAGKDLHTQRGGASPHVRRRSAASTSTGSRSSTGRSQFTCHMCYGVWCALKELGIHLRAKMSHRSRY